MNIQEMIRDRLHWRVNAVLCRCGLHLWCGNYFGEPDFCLYCIRHKGVKP